MRNIGLNDTRTAVLGVLVRMGAQVREAIEDVDQIEPRGTVEVTGAPLKGTVIQGKKSRSSSMSCPCWRSPVRWQAAQPSFATRRSCGLRKPIA